MVFTGKTMDMMMCMTTVMCTACRGQKKCPSCVVSM